MLQGERAHNGAVTRGSVGVAVAPVVGQKNLGEAAIGESADGAGVSQSAGLQIEGLGGTAIRKTHAGHGVPLRGTKNPSPGRSSAVLAISPIPMSTTPVPGSLPIEPSGLTNFVLPFGKSRSSAFGATTS